MTLWHDDEDEQLAMVNMQKKKTRNAKQKQLRSKVFAAKPQGQTALLGKTEAIQSEESSYDYSGAIIATSFTVLGAAAAAFAIKKCAGKRQDQDNFERFI